jgi:hypothetical protein
MQPCKKEYDFTLILAGIDDLTGEVCDALYEAGCDDATLGMQDGRGYLTFTREAASLKDAVLSAIQDVRKAKIGAEVIRLDVCDLVTQSDIARRTGRSRQVIHQYITGERGPKGFPAPACHITDEEGSALWLWCDVAQWLWVNDMISEAELNEARHAALINDVLDFVQQKQIAPEDAEEVFNTLCGTS